MHVLYLLILAVIISRSSNSAAFERFSLPPCDIPLILPYSQSDPDPKNLLPTALRPIHYDLKLEPHLPPGNFSFSGHVNIHLRCDENTKNITLNIYNITIFEETVHVVKMWDGSIIKHTRLAYNNTQERVVIYLSQELEALEDYSITMGYLGFLSSSLGFYRTFYEDVQKNVRENSDVDIYETSVPMSAYLVAFVICDFAFLSSQTSKTLVWIRPSEIEKIQYALEIGQKALNFFEEYFMIAYPLPKQDMIALPYLRAPGMENWGLITYQERALEYNESVSSDMAKMRLFTLVTHELAHQWFGNLVTLKWWNDLWLNEGFATYMSYIASDGVEPTWKMLDAHFFGETMYSVLNDDSTETSHPLSVTVNRPADIHNIFDAISYGKGASIIRMMHHFLGAQAFHEGLKNYLINLSFKNAIQDDLWHYLSEEKLHFAPDNVKVWESHAEKLSYPLTFLSCSRASKYFGGHYVDVKIIMDSWTLQTGYPMVEIHRNYENYSCTITQKRFLIDDPVSQVGTIGKRSTNYLWHIPLSFTTSEEKQFADTLPKFWMSNNTDKLVIGSEAGVPTSSQSWMLFNIQHTVFCRINYDTHNWKLLLEQLHSNHKTIHPINRAQIILDALQLARAEELDYQLAFNITSYLVHEREYLPWIATLKTIFFVYTMLRNSTGASIYKEYMLKILTPIYKHLGFYDRDSDTHTMKLLRMQILEWACKMSVKDCRIKAKKLFNLWVANSVTNRIPPNLKEIVLTYGMRGGQQMQWNVALQQYRTSNIESEKLVLLNALASSKDPTILRRFLDIVIDPNGGIYRSYFHYAFDYLLRTTEGHTAFIDFLHEKWQTVKEVLSPPIFASMMHKLLSLANTVEGVQQLRGIYATALPYKDLRHSDGNANVGWMRRHFNDVKNILEKL